jgi:hypothetical protein
MALLQRGTDPTASKSSQSEPSNRTIYRPWAPAIFDGKGSCDAVLAAKWRFAAAGKSRQVPPCKSRFRMGRFGGAMILSVA